MNIEKKNTLFIISLIIFVLVCVSSIALYLINQHISNEVNADLDKAFTISHRVLQLNNKELRTNASFLSRDKKMRQYAMDADQTKLKQFLQQFRQLSDNDLMVYFSVKRRQKPGFGVSRRAVFNSRRVLEMDEFDQIMDKINKTANQDSVYLIIDDEVINAVATPIKDKQDTLVGVLVMGKIIKNAMLSQFKSLHGIDVMLYRPNNVYGNTRPDFSYQAESVSENISLNKAVLVNIAGQSYFSKRYPLKDGFYDQARLFLLLSVLADEKKRVYVGMSINAFNGSIVVLLIAALMGIQISRKQFAVPVKDLVVVGNAIREGDLNVDIAHRVRKDELGDLARSLDDMRIGITDMHKKERLMMERMSNFADISSDWLWETDREGSFLYVSNTVSKSIGYTAEQLIGTSMRNIFMQDNLSGLEIIFTPSATRHKGFKNVEMWLSTKDGYRICLRFNATPCFVDNVFTGYRGTASDITKSKNDEDRLLRLANKDHLTGLSNRNRFMEGLEREIDVCDRQNSKGALLLIDLDHFKLVNDTAGHAAGDEVIVQIAGLLKKMTRSVDLIARLSGDEFVVSFVSTDISEIERRANELVQRINQLKPMYSGKIMNTTASIGIVVYPDHGDNAVDLLAKADTAMYKAKSEGRNRAYMYVPGEGQQEKMGSDLIWKDRVHDALENELFILAFQPIKPTTGESPSRYEVLVRMRSGTDNLFYPGDFIPTAEQFGLIRELDTWVVRKALGVLAKLPESYAHISFTINLSGLSVGEPAMLEVIQSEIEKSNLDRNRIIFEVTESAAFQDITRAIEFIDKIKLMGCRIALDDFGVGFSSFSYLKQLKADILKIDGSFIREIHNNKDDQLFVKALVDVARGMGMMTVAEFVESEQVYDIVRSLGVDYVQGYYIGKPKIEQFADVTLADIDS